MCGRRSCGCARRSGSSSGFGSARTIAQLRVGGDGAVIVADVRREQQPPQPGVVTHLLKVRVVDVDAQVERARAYGARVLQEPEEFEYGEREATVEDLAGHRWQFTQTIRDVAPEEWGGITVVPHLRS
jgi:uncharacterized glyoxalase superfamily protein PhnB